MIRMFNDKLAAEFALERGLPYGYCCHDGRYYVGTVEDLAAIGCVIALDDEPTRYSTRRTANVLGVGPVNPD